MKVGLTAVLLSGAVACSGSGSKTADAQVSVDTSQAPTISGSMQNLKDGLSSLLPLTVDRKQFNDPKNKSRIEKDVRDLKALSKSVNHNPAMTSRDPSLRFIARAFSEDLAKIDESLRLGKMDYARYGLLNLTAYCIECHTRTSSGPSFKSAEMDGALKKLKPLERGEFLLSTRQFPAALKEFKDFIRRSLNGNPDVFELDRAVRYSLAITIKFMKDPQAAQQIVGTLTESRKTPLFMKENAKAWAKAISEWKSEKKKKISTVADELIEVRRLVDRAGESAKAGAEQGGDIFYLRALSDIHLTLAKPMSVNEMGEALYLTGVSYEAVRDLSVWELHENYYEACIREASHTTWSKQCYQKMEESLRAGFTGSSGTHVPADVQNRLDRLKALAL